MYSQTVTVQQHIPAGPIGAGYLPPLFDLTRKGLSGVMFTGQGTLSSVSLSIPGRMCTTDAQTFTGLGDWRDFERRNPTAAATMRRTAAILFRRKLPLTLSAEDYSVYVHATYFIERCRSRVCRHMLIDSVDNPYGEKYTPP